MSFFLVFIGGGTGAMARFLLLKVMVLMGITNAYALMGINSIGSLIAGALLGWMIPHTEQQQTLNLLVSIGFCGGFTTFAAYSSEVTHMIGKGDWTSLCLYLVLSTVVCVFCYGVGASLVMSTYAR